MNPRPSSRTIPLDYQHQCTPSSILQHTAMPSHALLVKASSLYERTSVAPGFTLAEIRSLIPIYTDTLETHGLSVEFLMNGFDFGRVAC